MSGDLASDPAETRPRPRPERRLWQRLNRELIAWSVVVFLLGVAGGVLIITLSGRSSPSPIIITTRPPSSAQPTTPPLPIQVFISGEVSHPDVYELPAGSIIRDAVESAGGFTGEADRNVINLALRLSDGMHIHVPGVDDEISVPLVTGGEDSGTHTEGSAVNINRAATAELETLPGIGPSLAQRIVDHREMNGAFAQIEDITDVSGIGPAKFEAIKDMITVD